MKKTLFIEVRKKFDLNKVKFELLDKLPGKAVSLAGTIQYLDLVPKVKRYLEKQGRKVIIKKGAYYGAHVIGCNASAFDKNADNLLLLSDGKFHALNNAVILNKEIYVFSGEVLEKFEQKEIDKILKRKRGNQSKFLNSDSVGILSTIKPGQNFKAIKELKSKIEKINKKAYVFEADNINLSELDNFPDIKIWINTACYGLDMDDVRVVNLFDILEFL